MMIPRPTFAVSTLERQLCDSIYFLGCLIPFF